MATTRTNNFAALDEDYEKSTTTTAPTSTTTKWGDDVEEVTAPTVSTTSKPKYYTLAKAVNEAFGGNKLIFGKAFDQRYPLVNEEEWTQSCTPVVASAQTPDEEGFSKVKATKKSSSTSYTTTKPVMEAQAAVAWVRTRILQGLQKSVSETETRAKKARDLYNEAVLLSQAQKA
jgi:hypothetical protein